MTQDNQQQEYIIGSDDFERFAQQMIVTFPFMPEPIRREWQQRIARVRSHPATAAQCNADSFRAIIEQNRKEAAAQAREDTLLEIIPLLDARTPAYTKINLMLAKHRLDQRQPEAHR